MNRRAIAVAVMVLAAASITIASGSSSSSGGSSSGSSPGATSDAGSSNGGGSGDQVAGLNQPARDGSFEFVVKKLKCGVKSVGGDMLNAKAQGQFCLATMSVKNIGTEAQTFDASSQEAKNGEVTYKADGSASLYANKDPNTFLEQVNPGNAIDNVVVVFDIPKDGKIQTLVLHDSMFSSGVEVKAS